MKLLCLSNGHGEDAIAVRILRELQQYPNPPELAALPLVGEGQAYTQLKGVPIIGPVQRMPSGGFIYMDGRQLWRDFQGGLFQLILAQHQVVHQWAKTGGFILAVGDIVPLLLAWLSRADYAFVGTAKSEYYRHNEDLTNPPLLRQLSKGFGSMYLPWERWLMRRPQCKAVFPRDSLTTEVLQQKSIPALDFGNPMMDDLEPLTSSPRFMQSQWEREEVQRALIITLLPGSRVPEAYENWKLIQNAVSALIEAFSHSPSSAIVLPGGHLQTYQNLIFLAAIAPHLDPQPFCQTLISQGWQENSQLQPEKIPFPLDQSDRIFSQGIATLMLTQHQFNDCLYHGDFAIAMAGTATEQFVGLGKPAIAFPGKGPQFTRTFAKNQQRLLGTSLILLSHPSDVPDAVRSLLRDPDRLQAIAANGKKRMGEPGASRRIANHLIKL